MKRQYGHPITALLGLALASCAVGSNESPASDPDAAAWDPSALAAPAAAAACTADGSTKKMTITLADGEVALVATKTSIFVNGKAQRCPGASVDAAFGGNVAANIKFIDIKGPATPPDAATAKGVKVMLDGSTTSLPAGTSTASFVNVTLSGGARDEVWVRTGTGNDAVAWLKDADASKIRDGIVSLGLVGGSKADKNQPRKDIVVKGAGGLVFFLGAGNDTLAAGDAKIPLRVFGGDGNDTLTTGDANDLLQGSGGNDTLNAGKGNDLLQGSDGNDTLNGNDGDDGLDGGTGDDVLEGHAGCDAFNGGAGEDFNYDSDASQRVQDVEGDFSFGQTACTGNAPDVFGGVPAGGGASGGGSSGGGSSGGGSSGGGTNTCATGPKFVIADDGTEVNQCNGLVWQRTPDSTRRTLAAAHEYCSNLGAGYRLPTLNELYALLDFSKISGPHIDTNKFNPGPAAAIAPNGRAIPGVNVVDAANSTFETYNPSEYWTSSGTGLTGGANMTAFKVAFDNVGSDIGFSKVPASGYIGQLGLVRCVRGTSASDPCATGAAPSDNGDGSVTDCAGLRWRKTQSSTPLTLEGATNYCSSLAGGPWRLPTSSELVRVASLTRVQSLLDQNSFTDAKQCGYTLFAEEHQYYYPMCEAYASRDYDSNDWNGYYNQMESEVVWTSSTVQFIKETNCLEFDGTGNVVFQTCSDDYDYTPSVSATRPLGLDTNRGATQVHWDGTLFARCVK
ncbi:MAG: hypothetical protein RL199_2006 [Pseudomonadota bacterium]|jgi:Ca2+-binding RTX toxin-like protein